VKRELIQQPVRRQALISVRQFEAETRLACAPERRIKPIVTALPRIKAHGLAFTPDGKWLMVCCTDKVFILAVPSGKCVQVLATPKAYYNAAAISPDGKYIVTGEPRRQITLWDSHTGENLWQATGHEGGGIKKLAFTPDSSKVLSITLSKQSEIGVWDRHTGRLQQMVRAGVRDFAISPDGKTAIISEGLFISVMDLESGRFLREYACELPVRSFELSSDGKTVVGVDDKRNEKFLILDLPSGQSRWIDTGIHHEFFALHPQGEMVVATESDYDNRYHAKAETHFWDLRTGTHMQGFENGFDFPAAFSPDGKLMAAFNGGDLTFWELHNESFKSVWRKDPVWLSDLAPAISSNGNWMVTRGGGDGINLWDLQTGEVYAKLQGKIPKVDCLTVSPDGATLALTYWKSPVEVWNLASGNRLHAWQPEKPAFTEFVAFHPNGKAVAYADDGRITLREVGTGDVLQVLDMRRRMAKNFTFSHDSRSLVAEGYSNIYWWDLNWGRCILTPQQLRDYGEVDGHKFGKISAQMTNPENLNCIFGEWHTEGENHEFVYLIHLVDLSSGRYLQQFDGHNGDITHLAADPQWMTFVSADKAGDILKWDLRTSECILKFAGGRETGYMDEIVFIQVSPDGKHLIVGNRGGILFFWDYVSGVLLATAYNLSDGYLWTTPPDEFAPNGWLHTDRPDLVSLLETDKVDGEKPEYLFEGDKRFDDYLRIYNDGEMVMARLNEWDRYRKLLQIRLGNKVAMEDHLLSMGGINQRTLLGSGAEEGINP
jgi:WD40 repeat protein